MIGDPITGCRVELQDEGQDFLEFDIAEGRIQAGTLLVLGRKDGEGDGSLRLRYPVIRVASWKPV